LGAPTVSFTATDDHGHARRFLIPRGYGGEHPEEMADYLNGWRTAAA